MNMDIEHFKNTKRDSSRKRVDPFRPKKTSDKSNYNEFFEWSEDPSQKVLDDELSFKPLSDGLGFHNQNSMVENKPYLPKPHKGLWEKPKYFSFEEAKKKSFQDTTLQPFYEPSHEEVFNQIFEASEVTVNQNLKQVKPFEQVLAWGLDVVVISAITGLNLFLMFTSADISLGGSTHDFESIALCTSLWVFWYMIYFTFLEYSELTLGKRLMGLVLKSQNQSPIEFTQAFLRSFFSLFSIITLGLFSALNGPSAASKTEVFKSESKTC